MSILHFKHSNIVILANKVLSLLYVHAVFIKHCIYVVVLIDNSLVSLKAIKMKHHCGEIKKSTLIEMLIFSKPQGNCSVMIHATPALLPNFSYNSSKE